MILSVNDLNFFAHILLKDVKEEYGNMLYIAEDWYYSTLDRYDLKKGDKNSVVGSLADDLQYFNRILYEESLPSAVALEKLGELFISIGDKLNNGFSKPDDQKIFYVTIKIDDIEKICDLLFEKIEAMVGIEVECTNDFYYFFKDRFSFDKEDRKLVVGNTNEDIHYLRNYLLKEKKTNPKDYHVYGQLLITVSDLI